MKTKNTRHPQVLRGRIKRIFKLPVGWHVRIKGYAADIGLTAAELYSQLIEEFVDERLAGARPAEYLLPGKDSENKGFSINEHVVHKVKTLAARDVTSENRIMFTAVVKFAKNKLQLSLDR